MNIGDQVKLKSGSMKMTVKTIVGDSVDCIWYNYTTNQFDSYTFPMGVLEEVV